MTVQRSFARRSGAASLQTSGAKGGSVAGAQPGTKRTVRHDVQIGGLTGFVFESFSKDISAYSAGSTMSITLPMYQPYVGTTVGNKAVDLTATTNGNLGIDLLELSQTYLPLELIVFTTLQTDGGTFDFNNAEEFRGVVDTITLDMNTGTYTVQASSYARILANAKINEVFSSQILQQMTTSALAQKLVAEYGQGLKWSSHNSAFSTNVGTLMKQQLARSFMSMSVWDVLESFALYDDADLYVEGDTLFYVKHAPDNKNIFTVTAAGATQYTYTWGTNIEKLSIQHSPMFAHDISVTVKSYQASKKSTVTSTANASTAKLQAVTDALESGNTAKYAPMVSSALTKAVHRGRVFKKGQATAASISNKAQYVFSVNNLSQADCDRVAYNIFQDVSRREFIVTLGVLGQPDFNPRQIIKLQGTGTVADQIYAIKGFTTTSGTQTGYTTTFTLVNHNVQTVGANLGG